MKYQRVCSLIKTISNKKKMVFQIFPLKTLTYVEQKEQAVVV